MFPCKQSVHLSKKVPTYNVLSYSDFVGFSFILFVLLLLAHYFLGSLACSFTHSFIHSFNHPFLYSFIHSLIHSSIHSSIHSFIQSCIHSYVIHILINQLNDWLIHSLNLFVGFFPYLFQRVKSNNNKNKRKKRHKSAWKCKLYRKKCYFWKYIFCFPDFFQTFFKIINVQEAKRFYLQLSWIVVFVWEINLLTVLGQVRWKEKNKKRKDQFDNKYKIICFPCCCETHSLCTS